MTNPTHPAEVNTVRPVRIQRKRTKGWKMPANTVYVGRPTKWGNPFIVDAERGQHAPYNDFTKNVDLWKDWPCKDRATAVAAYRAMIGRRLSKTDIQELRGKNLACFCPLDQPCHADVLLEVLYGA